MGARRDRTPIGSYSRGYLRRQSCNRNSISASQEIGANPDLKFHQLFEVSRFGVDLIHGSLQYSAYSVLLCSASRNRNVKPRNILLRYVRVFARAGSYLLPSSPMELKCPHHEL